MKFRFLYSVMISLAVHSLLIFPTMCAENKEIKIKANSFKISDIEIVPSYIKEAEVVVESRKSPHGKLLKEVKTVEMDKTVIKGEENTNKYISKIRKELVLLFANNKTFARKKVTGKALLKIQIQKDGLYDILSINTENSKLSSLIEQTLLNLNKLPEIPDDTGKFELQLKIPLEFKYN